MTSATSTLTNRHSHPDNWAPIKEEPLCSRRPLKIIAIGAGFSGLTLAYKIKHEYKLDEKYLELVIYEKNSDVGGTWFEVRDVSTFYINMC
jgi:hypothetical protein